MRWIISGLLALIGLATLIAIGGYFVLKRPDIPYESLAARYENASSRYVDLPGGVRMHYRDEGDPNAPTLLLIHGFAASLHTWEPWVERLATGENRIGDYRIISIDLPGHGLTRAPAGYQASIHGYRDEIAAFAQAQGLARFAIAGNSMGGHIAWEYALSHPGQVSALILVDSAGWPDTSGPSDNGAIIFRLLENPMTASILRDLDTSRLIRQGLESAFPARPELVDDAMVARYSDLSRAPGHRDIILGIRRDRESRPDATPERLAALQLPVLILHGTDDRLIPFTHAEQFRDAIAGSRLIALDSIGHAPQEETPDETAMAVHEFLYQIEESSFAIAAE